MTKKSAMNIFTQAKEENTVQYTANWRNEILDSILLTGTATSDIKITLARRLQVLDFNSSLPRIKHSLIKKFNLILSLPNEISNRETIRCSICGKALFFNQTPVWHYMIKYAGNWFAAFICFDSTSPSRPSTKCYRRS